MFVTAQPSGQVARAFSTRNVFLAELALGELENVLAFGGGGYSRRRSALLPKRTTT